VPLLLFNDLTVRGGRESVMSSAKTLSGSARLTKCPVFEVRNTSRHLRTNFENQKGTCNLMKLAPLFRFEIPDKLAAASAGISNRRHQCFPAFIA
jgi:hypothetical protein